MAETEASKLRKGLAEGNRRGFESWIVIYSLLITLALVSIALNLWQYWAGARFALRVAQTGELAPPVTLLKPLKGCDRETERCLESWVEQRYAGGMQVLFGVYSADDPVCEIVRKLVARHAGKDLELVICQPMLGANGKVSTLAHLEKRVKHGIIVVSDADVAAPPDLVGKLVGSLEEGVGLVNCFYLLSRPVNLPMKLEAIAVNADFWSQVLQGVMLRPMDFALGAVMGVRRASLEAIGGFKGLVDYLADDYQLGHRIAATGARIKLSPEPVECITEAMNAGKVWRHQLRWARTIRVCRPAAWFLSIINNATLWPLALAGYQFNGLALWVCGAALGLRILTAGRLYRKLAPREFSWSYAFLAPVKDLLQMVIWALSFLGNRVEWRDEKFVVEKGGKLRAI